MPAPMIMIRSEAPAAGMFGEQGGFCWVFEAMMELGIKG